MSDKIGRPILHGAYSLKVTSELVKGQARRRLRKYLTETRATLAADLGGEERLTGAQRVLLDRTIGKLAVIRLLETYLSEFGVFDKGALRPALDKYLSFGRELRADLALLGIERREAEEAFDLGRYVAEKYPEPGKAGKEAKHEPDPGV
jgi:hypothetical protein